MHHKAREKLNPPIVTMFTSKYKIVQVSFLILENAAASAKSKEIEMSYKIGLCPWHGSTMMETEYVHFNRLPFVRIS